MCDRSTIFQVVDTLRANATIDREQYMLGTDKQLVVNLSLDYGYPFIHTTAPDELPTVRIRYRIIAEEENVSVGFEWRRYDWPDEIENRSGGAYIYAGTIEGSIKNLNAEKFWKIRPYFQSQAGNRYRGDWVTIDPSDASYFEPTVHTYKTISVEDNTAEVKGFVMQGSDDVESQGFVYWENTPASARR